jgi:molecular chaperone HtpG
LRFIKGVVDSADLPLNISRQMLQQERQIKQIQKWLTRKVLETLKNVHENEPEKYLSFWQQFGRALKEGVSSDFDNKNEIVSLLLFASSNDPEKLISLKDYVARMKEDQKEIFYLAGESRSVVENSPHLEAFKDKGYEVLYLVDPVDELVVQFLTEFEGKQLKSIGKGTVKLGSDEEEEEIKKKQEEATEMLQFLQQTLDQYVKDVRLTNRLRTSPVCLVGSEIDYSPQMERLLQMGKGGGPRQRRIMELNPQHAIFTKMLARFQKQNDDPMLVKYAHLLLGYGLIAEGSPLVDPVEFNRLVAELMEQVS